MQSSWVHTGLRWTQCTDWHPYKEIQTWIHRVYAMQTWKQKVCHTATQKITGLLAATKHWEEARKISPAEPSEGARIWHFFQTSSFLNSGKFSCVKAKIDGTFFCSSPRKHLAAPSCSHYGSLSVRDMQTENLEVSKTEQNSLSPQAHRCLEISMIL